MKKHLVAGAVALAILSLPLVVPIAQAQTTCPSGTHAAGTDPEVLVLTTPTELPRLCGRAGFEIQNLGPQPIYCATSSAAHARVNRARKVEPGEPWPINRGDVVRVWCIASVAQVQGGGTIVTEVR